MQYLEKVKLYKNQEEITMLQNKISPYKKMIQLAIGLSVIATSGISNASETAATQDAQAAKEAFYLKYKTSPTLLRLQVPGEYEEKCIGDQEDPMDLGAKMQTGEYRGECLDISSNRPVVILGGDENSDSMTIANLRYNGKFWIATFKKQSIKEVQFETVDFGKIHVNKPELGIDTDAVTAHTQIRYLFNEPIQLESQVVNGIDPIEQKTLSDLTFTFNAYGVNGVGYDVKAGMIGNFGLVGKAIATADRSVEEIIWDKSKVELHTMQWDFANKLTGRTTSENMYHYLYKSFTHSQNMGYKSILERATSAYNTAFRNCTTEAFDLIDEAFPELLAISGRGGKALPFLWSYFPLKNSFVKVDSHIGTLNNIVGNPVDTIKSDLKSNGTTEVLPSAGDEKEPNAITEIASKGWGLFSSVMKSSSNIAKKHVPGYSVAEDSAAEGVMERYIEAKEVYEDSVKKYNNFNQKRTDMVGNRIGFIYGVYKNIGDLAVAPSIANLKDRGFWSDELETTFLNDEFEEAGIKAGSEDGDQAIAKGICDQTTMCVKSNARSPANPTLGVRADVDRKKREVEEKAAAEVAAATKAAEEAAAAQESVKTETAADILAQ
jgi:hypothetical protein